MQQQQHTACCIHHEYVVHGSHYSRARFVIPHILLKARCLPTMQLQTVEEHVRVFGDRNSLKMSVFVHLSNFLIPVASYSKLLKFEMHVCTNITATRSSFSLQ